MIDLADRDSEKLNLRQYKDKKVLMKVDYIFWKTDDHLPVAQPKPGNIESIEVLD